MNKIVFSFFILLLITINIYPNTITYEESEKTKLQEKFINLLKEWNIEKDENKLPEVYVKDKKFFPKWRKNIFKCEIWDGKKLLYYIGFEEKKYDITSFGQDLMPRKKIIENKLEFIDKGRLWITRIKPEVPIEDFVLKNISLPEENSWKACFMDYYRVLNGYVIDENINIGINRDGSIFSVMYNYTAETVEVKINIKKNQAEKIAVDFMRSRLNLINKLKLLIGMKRITVDKEVSKDSRIEQLGTDKPIIIHPGFESYTDEEIEKEKESGILRNQPEMIINNLKNGSRIDLLRPVWVIKIKIHGFKYGADYSSYFFVDTETGKVYN
ncbi:MAG: hypothetical protein WC002_10110 [Candidatus Muiribacteriota bacterium]